jgi:hypothetical protein
MHGSRSTESYAVPVAASTKPASRYQLGKPWAEDVGPTAMI